MANINYIVDPINLTCQCSHSKYAPGKPLCCHLEYYLCEVMNLKKQYIFVLSIPRVRDQIRLGRMQSASRLNAYCLKFLTDDNQDHCLICHTAYLDLTSDTACRSLDTACRSLDTACRSLDTACRSLDNMGLYQCPNCFELLHQRCHAKWAATGGGCPRCKYKRDINGGKNIDTDTEWPDLNIQASSL